MFQVKKDLDAQLEDIHDVTTKENYQNVCIYTDISVWDKCFNKDGYLYQRMKSVGFPPRHKISRIWVECLLDNASFEERLLDRLTKNLFT